MITVYMLFFFTGLNHTTVAEFGTMGECLKVQAYAEAKGDTRYTDAMHGDRCTRRKAATEHRYETMDLIKGELK